MRKKKLLNIFNLTGCRNDDSVCENSDGEELLYTQADQDAAIAEASTASDGEELLYTQADLDAAKASAASVCKNSDGEQLLYKNKNDDENDDEVPNWLDPNSNNSIKGYVKTESDSIIPNARITARTEDFLFIIDHITTNEQGYFELNNLPSGEWVVFAETPPQNSLLKKSNEEKMELSGDTKSNIILKMKENNVTGVVSYITENNEQKAYTGVFVWAFRDNNKDGEPDYESEDFFETFMDVDDNGRFSLLISDKGNYTLTFDTAGSAYKLEPIYLQLEEDNEKKNLEIISQLPPKTLTGKIVDTNNNPVSGFKISIWKVASEGYPPTVPVNTIVGEDGKYKVLLEGGDWEIEVYPNSYELTQDWDTGDSKIVSFTQDESKESKTVNFTVTKPVKTKTVTGMVVDTDNNPISGVSVLFFNDLGLISEKITGSDGTYKVLLSAGDWDIEVFPDYERESGYNTIKESVSFTQDERKESKTINFTLADLEAAKAPAAAGTAAAELSKSAGGDADVQAAAAGGSKLTVSPEKPTKIEVDNNGGLSIKDIELVASKPDLIIDGSKIEGKSIVFDEGVSANFVSTSGKIVNKSFVMVEQQDTTSFNQNAIEKLQIDTGAGGDDIVIGENARNLGSGKDYIEIGGEAIKTTGGFDQAEEGGEGGQKFIINSLDNVKKNLKIENFGKKDKLIIDDKEYDYKELQELGGAMGNIKINFQDEEYTNIQDEESTNILDFSTFEHL